MRRYSLAFLILPILLLVGACDDEVTGPEDDSFVRVDIDGGGTVLQILPGPSPFADTAASTIARFPAMLQERFRSVAMMGPFSNNTAEISGTFQMSMFDSGAQGDSVSGSAEFQTADGSQWRLEFLRVNPNGTPPHAPHFGGVVTDFVFHGPTALHTPVMPLVRTEASMWGTVRVTRDEQVVQAEAPLHVMLTGQTRGPDARYLCYTCATTNAMEQVHLVSRSPGGPLYDVPGGFLHLTWQRSTFERSN